MYSTTDPTPSAEIHPRLKRRLDETMERRIAAFNASREHTRAGLDRAVALLIRFKGWLDEDRRSNLQAEAELLCRQIDRLATQSIPEGADIEALTGRLFRFAEALTALKPALRGGPTAQCRACPDTRT